MSKTKIALINEIKSIVDDIYEWPEYIIFEPLSIKKFRAVEISNSLEIKELNRLYTSIILLKEKCTFAILFKAFMINIINLNNELLDKYNICFNKLKSNIINENFLEKYEYFITWVWDLIVRFDMWPFIKFVFSVITVSQTSKK